MGKTLTSPSYGSANAARNLMQRVKEGFSCCHGFAPGCEATALPRRSEILKY
jgi:hypothetical protein